ncbi:hypothetical protein NUW58_g7477 [Xylaria curta]|uniref:Uncharacterized protein n=1 Tax=Xylaria curta TaxID=42375 RepID=A0ACC1NIZ3_9PEZI|nr:hypothetical protein NUW58_g7477 [Xylaria curta]
MNPLVIVWAMLAAVYADSLPHGPSYDNSGRWSNLTAVGTGPVQEHGTAATTWDLYVLGGISASNSTGPGKPSFASRRDVSAYNYDTGLWRQIPDMPVALTNPNVAVVDDNVYVLGGLADNGKGPFLNYSTACFVYETLKKEWTVLQHMPDEQGRGGAAMGVHGWQIYLAGGLRSSSLAAGGPQESSNLVSVYDTLTGQWSILPPLPEPRDHAGGVLVHHKFYVVGGRYQGYGNVQDTVWVINLHHTVEGWSPKSRMPTARAGLAVGVIDHRIVAFGGEGNPAYSTGVFPQVEAYDIHYDRWTKLDDMPIPRYGMTAGSVKGAILIPGGGLVTGGAKPVALFSAFSF